MTKAEKLEVVRFLDRRGAFLITKSGDRVCEFLNISKFTLYNYLDAVRSEGEAGPAGAADEKAADPSEAGAEL